MPKSEKNKNKNEKGSRHLLNIRSINKLIFLFVLFFCFYYLFCMNCLSIKGFELEEKKNALDGANKTNDGLELDIMSIESYISLNDKIGKLGMVRTDKIEFIGGKDDIAKK
jgi:hypothetical protein